MRKSGIGVEYILRFFGLVATGWLIHTFWTEGRTWLTFFVTLFSVYYVYAVFLEGGKFRRRQRG